MAMNNGTKYEAELKKLLIEKGFSVLDMGREETCDLLVLNPVTLIEVKSTTGEKKYFSQREKAQLERLVELAKIPNLSVCYAIRFAGAPNKPVKWNIYTVLEVKTDKFMLKRTDKTFNTESVAEAWKK